MADSHPDVVLGTDWVDVTAVIPAASGGANVLIQNKAVNGASLLIWFGPTPPAVQEDGYVLQGYGASVGGTVDTKLWLLGGRAHVTVA